MAEDVPASTSGASVLSPKPPPSGPAWGALASAVSAPISLGDVMSEELAQSLQVDEINEEALQKAAREVDFTSYLTQDDDTANDLLLAQMLQHEFDKEHDAQLRVEENHVNKQSRVRVSYDNYKAVHPALILDEDLDPEEVEEEEEEDEAPKMPKKGYIGRGKNIITKHDAERAGHKNANRVIDQFPPGIHTGDASKIKMRLPNHVYNKLKKHSNVELKRNMRLHEKKEHSTAVMAVDEKTRLLLYKLMNNGTLDQVNGVVSTGKESVVLHADGGYIDDEPLPAECAIKVFKTTLNEFKNRGQYVKGDVRFFKDAFKKQNPRKIIKLWAIKEEHNLKRLRGYGIPVPDVVTLKKHVLVMSFIGENAKPAPKLKDARLGTVDMQMAYEQVMENMKKMYQEAGIVHGDLSEYNLLWHNDQVIFIDVSQSVEKFHPYAKEFLLRDCNNMCRFFKNAGIPNVPSHYDLFNEITGLSFQGEGAEFLQQVEEYEKNEEKLREQKGKAYSFNYFFEMAQKQHEDQKGLNEDDDSEEEEESLSEGEFEEDDIDGSKEELEKHRQATPVTSEEPETAVNSDDKLMNS